MCGLSEEQVRLVLNLEKRFEDKKILHRLLVNGEVSINKLAKIASIATANNQESLANQSKILPCRALETLARDEKLQVRSLHVNSKVQQDGLFVKNTEELQFSDEIKQRLMNESGS